MPTYKVEVTCVVRNRAFVTIGADSAEEALVIVDKDIEEHGWGAGAIWQKTTSWDGDWCSASKLCTSGEVEEVA